MTRAEREGLSLTQNLIQIKEWGKHLTYGGFLSIQAPRPNPSNLNVCKGQI